MKTLIIYNSHHGTTKKYAFEIEKFLKEKQIESKVSSIEDYSAADIENAEQVLLGCWTSGLMIFAQHPDKKWKQFAKNLPDLKDKKLGFFTTYKLATGSMFRKMEKVLDGKINGIKVIIKSKNDQLTEENKQQLEEFLK